MQETFVQAMERHRREHIRNWPGLLRRIAVMTSLAALRRRKLRHTDALPQDLSDRPESAGRPDEVMMRRELEERLRREVVGLPEQEASVFCLRYFESMSVPETADALGIPPTTVSVALHRARKHLERRMTDVLSTTS